ncbi:MAG: hypothetical protein WEE66_07890 [Actinomycetota bacterium]
MSIEIKPVDPRSIPAAKGGNESKKWREAVVAFMDSDAEAVEVMGETDSRKASTGLRAAVAGLDQVGEIKVVRRGERTFLVKVDESTSP